MMDIKFRGKRKKDGRWVYGYFVKNMKMNEQGTITPVCYITTGEHYYEVDCSTVGLFVGLEDKYHQEIYEGDILNIEAIAYGKGMKAVVFYDNGGFMLRWEDGIISYMQEWADEIIENGEVIGNIYENPELLKEMSEEWK